VKKFEIWGKKIAMAQISYAEVADQAIRNFLKAVVLIDDHWSEAQSAPVAEEIDPDQVNLDPQSIPPQDGVDSTGPAPSEAAPAALTSITDPAYLRKIGDEVISQGLLFTGFAYRDALSATALKLASKADILILDWYLGTEDSRPALDLLESLKDTGSPRFIFILTDKDLAEVRKQIGERLGVPPEGTSLVFSCGPFSFSLKNKHQVGGPNSVLANQVLDEAIAGIRERFGGLLQLAALELFGQYRDCLHEVLDQFNADTDLPFILEWLEKDSPIRDSHSFNSLAIDEWAARVARRFPASTALTIKNESVTALLAEWKNVTTLPDDSGEMLKVAIKGNGTSFPADKTKIKELMDSLDAWMGSSGSSWPATLEGSSRKSPWSKDTKRVLAINYLGLRKGDASPIEKLIDLDVLFQCQAYMPPMLSQGTVLIDPNGNYLICTTTTCDCSRPVRVKNCFVFLEAKKIDSSTLKDHPEGSIVAIQAENSGMLLAVSPKPTYTYKIENPSLESDLEASFAIGSKDTFVLKPVAQLRPARVQSLISLTAGKSIEVGLDRSELLRQLCKSN
jgi:hypothetical protein